MLSGIRRSSTFCIALCFAFPLFAAQLFTGCVTQEKEEFLLEGPLLVRPAARNLVDAPSGDVLVETDDTVADMPLHAQTVRRVAEKAKKAVVSIYTATRIPYRVRLLPIKLPGTHFRVNLPGTGLGSGFIIHPSGYILSNNHVIQHAREIRALTRDGADYPVIVVARDPAYDLALLKIQSDRDDFPALPMGDSEAVGVGDMVVAVGNPLGLGHTVTQGIISQTGRNLSGVSKKEARQVQFIQTDTAINPGSSGGPLITLTGAWIGVNTAGIVEAQNIGFAVPSGLAREFLDEIRSGKGEEDPAQ